MFILKANYQFKNYQILQSVKNISLSKIRRNGNFIEKVNIIEVKLIQSALKISNKTLFDTKKHGNFYLCLVFLNVNKGNLVSFAGLTRQKIYYKF